MAMSTRPKDSCAVRASASTSALRVMSQVAATPCESRRRVPSAAAASRPATTTRAPSAREAPGDRLAHVVAAGGAEDDRDLAL